jgi:hypothetical protein
MKKLLDRDKSVPRYSCEPIHSIAALEMALGIPEQRLKHIAATANQSYRLAAEEVKKDGSKRQTFDAYPRLKFVQRRIKECILSRVEYPDYLNGSLKGRSPRKNAEAHVGAKITISEDIANFFPTISSTLVKAMWFGLFGFSDEVANLLTLLTTKDEGVPQGAITSSYLANLVFWATEPQLYNHFRRRGYQYTRYVDDISVSCKRRITDHEKSEIISSVYAMLRTAGVKPKRKKHEVHTARSRITTTKLVHNSRVSLPKETRRSIRASVYQLECRVAFGEHNGALQKELLTVSSRVGLLNSFHPSEGALLKTRLKLLRNIIEETAQRLQLVERIGQHSSVISNSEPPPWN